ncbi:MAG: SIR2 family protein [Acetobacter sp.]|nr:SIR2 family protein [Acetobacter sp.]
MTEDQPQNNDNNSETVPSDPPPFSVPFSFWKGGKDILEKTNWEKSWESAIETTQEEISGALNAQRVSFLLGAGCSSSAIPTMKKMVEEFKKTIHSRTPDPDTVLQRDLGIDLQNTENLESLLGRLYNAQKALGDLSNNQESQDLKTLKDAVKKTIEHIRKLILDFFLQKNSNTKKYNFNKAIELYQQFYQKLIFRDRALPRPWIFTTNYDLFNEQAMDRLGIPYCNGFSGVIERYFNPSVFRYSLGQQLDISSRHWEPVDHFVYLCKLHGSISWQESQENTSLFRIKEIQPGESDTSADPAPVLIYPTPMKQSASLGSPYVDLFREFHKQIVCEQSVLFTIGYSFGDEHINNIIFQALTIPNFRLIILIDKNNFKSGVVKTLFELDDPRIWIISDNDTQTNQGTDKQKEQKAYHFETFIKHFMPPEPPKDSDKAIRQVIKECLKEKK